MALSLSLHRRKFTVVVSSATGAPWRVTPRKSAIAGAICQMAARRWPDAISANAGRSRHYPGLRQPVTSRRRSVCYNLSSGYARAGTPPPLCGCAFIYLRPPTVCVADMWRFRPPARIYVVAIRLNPAAPNFGTQDDLEERWHGTDYSPKGQQSN